MPRGLAQIAVAAALTAAVGAALVDRPEPGPPDQLAMQQDAVPESAGETTEKDRIAVPQRSADTRPIVEVSPSEITLLPARVVYRLDSENAFGPGSPGVTSTVLEPGEPQATTWPAQDRSTETTAKGPTPTEPGSAGAPSTSTPATSPRRQVTVPPPDETGRTTEAAQPSPESTTSTSLPVAVSQSCLPPMPATGPRQTLPASRGVLMSAVVNDGNIASLQAALDGAAPGTEIVVSGAYVGRLDFDGVHGTAQNPITVRANGAASIESLGTDSAVFFRNTSHVDLVGFVLDGGGQANAVVGIGGRYGDKGADGSGGSAHHVRVTDSEIRNSGQELVKVLNDSHHIVLERNSLHGSGHRHSGKYGEAIYIGSANSGPDNTHSITVHGNIFTDLTAEAVDIKSQGTHSVWVTDNVIHDLSWPSYGSTKYNNGAIAVGQQRDGSNGDRLSGLDYLVEGNWIWNFSESVGSYQDAVGIQAWSPATIRGNVVYATDNDGIELRDPYSGSGSADRTFVVEANYVWGAGRETGFDGIAASSLRSSTEILADSNRSALSGLAASSELPPPPVGFHITDGCW